MATRDEIEAQIVAKPYDDDAYLILGDLLQVAGDPRGELIAIDAAALRAGPGEHAAFRKRRAELLARSPELALKESSDHEVHWHLGFVRRVRIVGPKFERRELFGHPSMQFATELEVSDEGLEESWLAELTASLPLLQRLTIGSGARYWIRAEDTFDLGRCVHHLDQLEELTSGRSIRFAGAALLRVLDLSNVTRETLDWLAKAELPKLARLALELQTPRLTTPEMSVDDAPVARIDDVRWLVTKPPRVLRELELVGASFGDALIAALVGSPLLRQLRVLRLWNAGITAAGARAITREAFGHLELLDLSDPTLDDETIAMVDGACKEVRTLSPRLRDLLRRDG